MGKNILFKHNLNAYAAAISMMKQTGKAAVVHPTGTGKSFIAFQLCMDNKEKKICWLSPSEYIFETQKEKWLLAGGQELDNIQFITYARLMRMKGEKLADIKPDYIILDEFHRCGAAQWGDGANRLREMYPEALVLGLSATSIRYLDNQRDMAWELFDGNIASELTLGAAVVRGILPAPNYVLSVYSYQRQLQKYERGIQRIKNKRMRDKAEKELQALRRALEKADGLEEIFARHMSSGSGKYIVFCANYDHLNEMRALAPEWFAKVDRESHIYTAYSDDPATAEEFQHFKADQSEHLKLLYCIDMLNEGIHIDDVDGVILLRPTVSPTIYKQQIGRALAAGTKKTPIIFDIVMNIENLCSIGAMEEELYSAVFALRANGRGDEIVHEHFQMIDEVKDCRKLFMQLNETLGASWEAMYAMAREYFGKYGNLNVPSHYTTPEGYSLGAWITTQRKVFLGKTAGILSETQIKQLDEIGMQWQGIQDIAWERNFLLAENYFMEHGDLKVPADYVTKDGCKLGRWVRRQREKYQNYLEKMQQEELKIDGKIMEKRIKREEGEKLAKEAGRRKKKSDTERIMRLTKIGMIWEIPDSWEYRFELAKHYYNKHGNLKMPGDYVVEGVWLERWIREQKAKLEEENKDGQQEKETSRQASRRLLTKEQKQKLLSIGIKPGESQAELSWWQQYGEAEEFYQRYGNLAVPKRYISGNGKSLKIWLSHQRANRREAKLASWQVRMLDGIGMVWESPDTWEIGFAHAEDYFLQTGNLTVPNAYICEDGYRLGKWISNQRYAYGGIGKRTLSQLQIQRLEAIGMRWSVKQGRQAGKTGEKR